jgi:hypothetical protein
MFWRIISKVYFYTFFTFVFVNFTLTISLSMFNFFLFYSDFLLEFFKFFIVCNYDVSNKRYIWHCA